MLRIKMEHLVTSGYHKSCKSTFTLAGFVALLSLECAQALCPLAVPSACTCSNLTNNDPTQNNSAYVSISCIGANLTNIPSALTPMIKLRISSDRIDTLQPIPYSSLTELQLDNNQMRYCESGALSGLHKLMYLNFNGNLFHQLPPDMFDGLESLVSLQLSMNQLETLPSDIFGSNVLPNLKNLDLSMNHFKVFDSTILQSESLTKVVLEQNKMESISACYRPDKRACKINVENLDLSDNLISSLELSPFKSFSALKILNLNGNKLKILTQLSFAGAEQTLEYIDAGKNDLTSTSGLDEMLALSTLDLRSNRLSDLEQGQLPMKTMHRLELGNNPWNCSCRNKWIRDENDLLTSPYYSVTCAFPAQFAREPMLNVPEVVFDCSSQRSLTTVLLVIMGLVVFSVAVITMITFVKAQLKHLKKEYDHIDEYPSNSFRFHYIIFVAKMLHWNVTNHGRNGDINSCSSEVELNPTGHI